MHGAAGGGGGGSGTALDFGGYWSRALHFWGNRSHGVKRRLLCLLTSSPGPVLPVLPHSCLRPRGLLLITFYSVPSGHIQFFFSAHICHWAPGGMRPTAHSVVMQKKKDVCLVSSGARPDPTIKRGGRFQISKRKNFLTRRDSEKPVGLGARQTQARIPTLLF